MEYHSGGSLPLLGRPRYCPGANANGGYLCETGHCCGETGCCTYYYELWWFWLLWTILILFSCCCAYRHRRAKLRVQQQQRQREISLLAYHGANSFTSSMLDLSFLASLKLPSYEEVAAQPSTPPPPYSSVFTTPRYPQPPRAADPHLLTQHGPLLHRPLSDGPSSLSSDNSSSCSCDSCCPSSPCSSSLSAPITYETDTSHASTPSEATPLTLDVTMETISAAADCLRANGARLSLERTSDDIDASRARKPPITDTTVSSQTVTTAVVTRAASPQPPPELNLPLGVTTVVKQQLDIASCSSTITIETESSFAPYQSPPSSPSSIPSPTSPPSLEGQSTTSLLLDPLTALHQSDRGGSFSGHASSLSPSPRATQSPPKQTLFSPCVDVFEPVPPSLEDEEEDDQEEKDEEDDEDMGADESQYRHRRLTGDSGIEVCRCRVEEEDDNEEEEESRRGGGDIELHDSVDCPARGQLTPRDGLTLCTPTAATTPTSEDSGEVVIVMETV
ncbi:uncharacterized protein KZ484_011461 [Pholidichthys leucotaenia]